MSIERLFGMIFVRAYALCNYRLFRNDQLYGIPRIVCKKRLILGNYVTVNPNVFLHASGGITIGNNVVISYGVSIISTGLNTKDWADRTMGEDRHIENEIVIGNNVWLCANVTVCPGVRIADNCIVAAGSVVVRNLEEENFLYGGIPAKKIKQL